MGAKALQRQRRAHRSHHLFNSISPVNSTASRQSAVIVGLYCAGVSVLLQTSLVLSLPPGAA